MTRQKTKKNRFLSVGELMERITPKDMTPPRDVAAEESVVGSMLRDAVACQQVIQLIGSRSEMDSPFWSTACGAVYRACYRLFEQQQKVDELTVSQELRRSGELGEVGGPAYLVELAMNVVTTANVEDHARLILEHYMAREGGLIFEDAKLKLLSGEHDPLQVLADAATDASALTEIAHRKKVMPISTLVAETTKLVEAIQDTAHGVTGVPTQLSDLDELTGGWQKTDLIIVAARPSQGKTAEGLAYVRGAAIVPPPEKRVPTAIFSLEMGAVQLVQRLVCAEGGIDLMNVRKGRMTKEERRMWGIAAKTVASAPIFIDDTAGITPIQLRAKCLRLKQLQNIGLVVVDYLQLMEANQPMDSREREISTISRSLKGLAKELDIPVIVLSQLNRKVEDRSDKRPNLGDLRESGAIEQDADLVLFIYRPETYGQEKFEDGAPTEGAAMNIIAKQRNGPIGDVRLKFQANTGRFGDFVVIPKFESEQAPMF
ncbi:MAG: replicative DNA helicase [Bacteroidetes bacterium]|nr:replicative DNA helicase [Bacteroidota bacterium]